MLESLPAFFKTLASAANAARAFQALLKGKQGDVRALIEEIKENASLCEMVVKHDTDIQRIIPELTTSEYDRILRLDYFDFNSLNKAKISAYKGLQQTDLAAFIGKDTKSLVVSIYDKIKELKRLHRLDKDNPKILWRRRMINIYKRILLLLRHLRG